MPNLKQRVYNIRMRVINRIAKVPENEPINVRIMRVYNLFRGTHPYRDTWKEINDQRR